MRPRRRLPYALAAVGAFALAGSVVAAVPATAGGTPDEKVIDLYGINDFHGRIEADGASAGAAVLSGAIQELRGENPNSLFVSAGDDIGASTFTSFIQDDEPTIDALNAAGLQAIGVGNHEFDQGFADIVDRVEGLTDAPILGANVFHDGTDDHALDPSHTITVDGVDVAFVGAVTEDLPSLVSPSGIEEIEIRDIPESVNAAVEELESDPETAPDVVVLLVHEGASNPSEDAVTSGEMGRILDGVSGNVDAVFTGHTHLAYNHEVDLGGDVDVPVVQSGQYGENLANIELTVAGDEETGYQVTEAGSEILPLATEVDEGNWEPNYPADEEVQAIVDAAVEEAEELGNQPVGEISEDINRAVQASADDEGDFENRGGESTLGNLVADVQLGAAQVTDEATEIAFMNPGGLRTDLEYASSGDSEVDPDGNVTYREVAEVQPFANTLVTMTLTGEQILQVLEEQWQPDDASRPFLKLGVAGLTYTYDPAGERGAHITEAELADGTPLDPAGEYRVVVNSFLASGGDNFSTLAEGADQSDTGQIDLEAMVNFFEAADEPVAPDRSQRAVGVDWQTEGPYGPGDEIAIDLSSLLFSDDELDEPTVEVTLGDEQLGSFPVDATLTDASDEVGQASVSVTVPEDLASMSEEAADLSGQAEVDAELVVSVTDTPTEVALPIVLDVPDPGDDTGGDDGGTESGDDTGTETGDDTGTETGDDTGTETGDDTGAESGDEGGTAGGTDDGGELPDTGASPMPWIIGAIVVLALGGGLYAWSRRRSSGGSSPPPAA